MDDTGGCGENVGGFGGFPPALVYIERLVWQGGIMPPASSYRRWYTYLFKVMGGGKGTHICPFSVGSAVDWWQGDSGMPLQCWLRH